MVVLPTPGGPHRISEASEPCASIRVMRALGADQVILADHLVERARPQPVGQRAVARSSGRCSSRLEQIFQVRPA